METFKVQQLLDLWYFTSNRHIPSSRYVSCSFNQTEVQTMPILAHSFAVIFFSPPHEPRISIAVWSPTGHSIAYVIDNDIYLITSPDQVHSPLRLTTTGAPTIFNGICDWVYEEEVFSASEALWWSPDSKKLVWLSLDESKVPIYELNTYNPTSQIGNTTPFPRKTHMKYPKPGFSNPIVSVAVFDLEAHRQAMGNNPVSESISQLKLDSEFDDNDRIVMEVAWVSAHELIVRQINRIATREKTGYFDLSGLATSRSVSPSSHGRVVMDVDYVKFDGGWSEPVGVGYMLRENQDFAVLSPPRVWLIFPLFYRDNSLNRLWLAKTSHRAI